MRFFAWIRKITLGGIGWRVLLGFLAYRRSPQVKPAFGAGASDSDARLSSCARWRASPYPWSERASLAAPAGARAGAVLLPVGVLLFTGHFPVISSFLAQFSPAFELGL